MPAYLTRLRAASLYSLPQEGSASKLWRFSCPPAYLSPLISMFENQLWSMHVGLLFSFSFRFLFENRACSHSEMISQGGNYRSTNVRAFVEASYISICNIG